MKNELRTWVLAATFTVLTACGDRIEPVNYLKDAPVVAARVMIDEEELVELDPSLLRDTVIFPLSYFTEEPEIIKLDNRDEALTGAPYAYVSDHYIMTGMVNNIPFKLFDRQGKYIADVGGIGQGPGEYRFIYAAKIDEYTQRIYMLPFFGKELLVYDFKGNVCPPVPLVHEGIVAQFALRGDTVVILGSPQPNKFASCVWTQDLRGNLIHEFPTGRLDFDFRGVTINSQQNTERIDFSFWIPKAQLDSLYEVNLEKGELIPRFTAHFKGEALKPHMYGEFPDHYVGEATGQWIQSKTDDDGNIQRRIAGDLPTYYIVDKQTLRGAYFGIENDWLDGERLEMPLGLNYGYYMTCLEPGVLAERIEKALRSDHLTERTRKLLTEVQAGITENDNNYLLYAKLKRH